MRVVIDQLNRTVHISENPQRIISLVPSQTELLYDLGLENEIVGVTRFCVHPKQARKEKVIIGGTKDFDFEKIKALNPDLIIGNKEENYEEGIDRLSKDYPVWMSDIHNLQDALQMIQQIGEMTNTLEKSGILAQEITLKFQVLKSETQKSVAYLIWNKPLMVAGTNTFISDILFKCGLNNIFQDRYPEITIEELEELKPDYLFLSSEPYPFKEKNCKAFQEKLPQTKVKLVDGEFFSWYGSRLKLAPKYFNELLLSLD